MNTLKRSVPRRYIADHAGHRVLVGLTREETAEFEHLDADVHGVRQQHEAADTASNCRWTELYIRHDIAWKNWLTSENSGKADSSFVN